jgi:hypothetical protein
MNLRTRRRNTLAFRLKAPLNLTTTGIDPVDRKKKPGSNRVFYFIPWTTDNRLLTITLHEAR